MKKRILSILLTLCMMLCLTPISVFAEEVGAEGSAAIQLGADAISVLSKNVNTATAPTVYFGQNHDNNPAAWRVIGYDGSGVASSHGDITMLAANNMGLSKFGASNAYADSALKEAIDALADKLTAKETDAVEKRTLASGNYDGENTDGVAGPAVSNAVFWPLSSKEANAVNNDLRVVDPEHPGWASSYWWLRSPDEDDSTAYVAGRGEIRYYGGYSTSKEFGVRPAFDLNLDSVLFASAAVGGKPDGGLTEVSKYSGNEWKLTLLDSRRNFAVTEKTVSAAPDDTVTLNYKGATTGKNEYISVILADNNGAQYYGRVAQPTAESGTVEIKIPSDIAPGDYTMKVFSEQYNGDCKTDLASAFADVTLTVESQPDEQFTLAPGGRYYFDLSAMNIPGTVNSNLPDSTLHYVPFTYVGTVNAYKLTSEMATTEEYAQKNKYPHSLFIADYAVTHTVSWDDLNTAGLIFGKNYASGGVDYTLRAPSVGSGNTGSGDSERGTPQSNEWDAVLDKNSGYIKNWNGIYSWGQDTTRYSSSYRAFRGYNSARYWFDNLATRSFLDVGFRPVLEILNPDTLSSDGLKVVTLDLGGGTLGGSSDAIQIIVKSSESFAAPASDGMTRPDGNTGSYFMWLGSNGKLYAPGASVPADVTKLTAQFALSEQFSLTPGGRYYFDLSAMDIPGTVNSNLPDSTLHYVPFTYAGTVDAYVLKPASNHVEDSSEQASVTKDKNAQYGYAYEHSLFIADYRVTTNISWIDLNNAGFIFGKTNTAGGINYTLRAPTMGSIYKSPMRGAPANNEWDQILAKNSDFIKELDNNRNISLFWGQDTSRSYDFNIRKTTRNSVNNFMGTTESSSYGICFRPVLEVMNPDTLGSDGLKAVTLDLGGGKLGNSSEDIQIIVKNGSTFTAPASDGLTRPDGNTDSYFMWLDGNGNSYEPGGSVPADVTELTVQWTAPTYAVTLNTNGGTINNGNVTEYTYGVGATLPAADDMTYTGHTFKGWYDNENLTGSPVTAIGGAEMGNKEYWAKWEINQYTITFDTNGGSEIAPITQDYGTEITAPDNPTRKGYTFKGWDKEIPETMPADNITVKAQWEINQYTITFDTNGGSEIAPITQDYGTEITAPDNPTRKGYTFKGWDKEIPETMPAENITVKAQWEINQYTIAFDTNGGSEIAPITQDYGTEITAPDNPTRKGYTFKGWDKEIPKTMPAENITITARWKDTEKPTGEIIIGTNKWNQFLNELTFGIFFKDTQEVTINAVDNSGVVFVSYLVTDKELSESELNSLVFRAYEEPFCIEPNGEYIIYVMLVDENINITYLRSDRLTLDNIQPVISGIENGKTYCEAQTVTVDEKYVDTVTVNGTAVTLDADGGFVLPPTNGEQKIVVTDKAGNNAEMTVTVNNGHTFGEWVSDNDGKHTRKCTVDGCDAFETENCSGGNATCTEKAVCDVCGKAYGEFDGTNHEGGVQEWTTRTAFNHEQKWNCCGAVIVASEAHEWKDGVCRECGYVCLHNDADKDHICDYCKKTISEHVDKDKNHICDYCKKTISAHEDAPTEEIKKADTVTAKLPDDSKSPQTGDNSNLILWIALLIISGGVMKGVTAFGKSKKHSAKINK